MTYPTVIGGSLDYSISPNRQKFYILWKCSEYLLDFRMSIFFIVLNDDFMCKKQFMRLSLCHHWPLTIDQDFKLQNIKIQMKFRVGGPGIRWKINLLLGTNWGWGGWVPRILKISHLVSTAFYTLRLTPPLGRQG